jgi:Holliday junction DNA helicase RuvA
VFNSLTGTLTEKRAGVVCIDTGGVEWEISVSDADAALLGAEGGKVRIFTWLYIREDVMRLIGFVSPQRRSVFLDLLTVDGVGVKGAQKIIGSIDLEALETALETEDVARLSKIPGLGKKTAQKMILALKGKLARVDAVGKSGSTTLSQWSDLENALIGMGFDRRAAAEALTEAGKKHSSEGDIFREAVLLLTR